MRACMHACMPGPASFTDRTAQTPNVVTILLSQLKQYTGQAKRQMRDARGRETAPQPAQRGRTRAMHPRYATALCIRATQPRYATAPQPAGTVWTHESAGPAAVLKRRQPVGRGVVHVRQLLPLVHMLAV